MTRSARIALGVLSAWTAYGVFRAQLYVMTIPPGPNRPPAAAEYVSGLLTALVWASFTPVIVWIVRRAPLRRERIVGTALVHLGAMMAFAVVDQGLDGLLYFPSLEMRPPFAFRAGVIAQIYQNVFHYLIVAAIAYAASFRAESEQRQVTAARLETQLARARVQALQMQLHPHFLFNALSSVTELLHKDPRRAERLVVRIAELLRLTLAGADVQEVPLRREMELLRAYLDIQTTRFSDRLTIGIDVGADAIEALVPNMILQPLVENAVRHGIAPLTGRGHVQIVARRHGDELRIEVRDNGTGFDGSSSPGAGLGLRSTRERLEQLYPGRHELIVGEREEGGVAVSLAIPFRKSA